MWFFFFWGGGAGFFLKIFFLFFFPIKNQRIVFSVWEPKYFFQDKAKTKYFFSKQYIRSKCILRFIRSCISWTQYTWVYCLYVRVYMYLGYLGPSVYVHIIIIFFQFQLSSDNLSCWCSSFYIEWYSLFFWGVGGGGYKLKGKYVNERYSLGARNIYFP